MSTTSLLDNTQDFLQRNPQTVVAATHRTSRGYGMDARQLCKIHQSRRGRITMQRRRMVVLGHC